MKKRVLSLLLCGLMTVSLLAGCGSKEAPAAEAPAEADAETEAPAEDNEDAEAPAETDGESDMAYVQGKGTLVVGITDFEPMDYKDENGEWIGFDADMAKAFGESLGVDEEFAYL